MPDGTRQTTTHISAVNHRATGRLIAQIFERSLFHSFPLSKQSAFDDDLTHKSESRDVRRRRAIKCKFHQAKFFPPSVPLVTDEAKRSRWLSAFRALTHREPPHIYVASKVMALCVISRRDSDMRLQANCVISIWYLPCTINKSWKCFVDTQGALEIERAGFGRDLLGSNYKDCVGLARKSLLRCCLSKARPREDWWARDQWGARWEQVALVMIWEEFKHETLDLCRTLVVESFYCVLGFLST